VKKLVYLFLLLVLPGCENLPKNPEQWMIREKNACLPTAIAFKQGLNRQDIWSEVVRYTYKRKDGKYTGHAIVAYLYPPGKNQLWTYDYEGSWRTRAFINDPKQIATQAEIIRGRSYNTILYAEFLK
jgi:hypothetical protein